MAMILSITLNPSVDTTLFVKKLLVSDTNRVTRQEHDAGGKGINLSRIAVEIGGESTATGFLGGHDGRVVLKAVLAQGVAAEFVQVAEETRRNFNVESVEEQVPPTTLNSRGAAITLAEWNELVAVVERLSQNAKWVAMGGSLPPGAPADAYGQLITIAQNNGAKTLLDADGEAMVAGLEARPHLIKPNSKEAARLLGYEIPDPETAASAAHELLRRLAPGGMALISLGAKGAVLACHDATYIGSSPKIVAKSTIGSGDSLLGAFLMKLSGGESPEVALRWGLAAGAATAMTDGTQIGRKAVIEGLVREATVRLI